MSIRSAGLYLLIARCLTSIMVAEPSPQDGPGLEGVILISPNRPGPIRKDAADVVPAANVTFQVKQGDQKVASFTTDAEGHFQLALPAGHYVIDRDDPGASAGYWHFEAEVTADKRTSVRWTADSGMR